MTQAIPKATLLEVSAGLAEADADLARVQRLHGPPPLWARRPGFATLVRIILEQQVSLASARAAFAALQRRTGAVTPERVLEIGTRGLRAAGLTRQKARYVCELADGVAHGRVDLARLHRLSDADVRERLTAVVGIGPWTADIYLIMALGRPDVWPVADLALAKSVMRLKRLRRVPDEARLERIASAWRPWRSVAARMAWHYYLCGYG